MKVYLYSDGACFCNPGKGGYCAILKCNGSEKVISGYSESTTNNRMELIAVIEGLKALKKPCEVTVVSDSQYVCNAINKKWMFNWKKRGWKKSANKPVPNTDLWLELDALLKIHKVEFQWVPGHAGHPENERCDRIAVAEYTSRSR